MADSKLCLTRVENSRKDAATTMRSSPMLPPNHTDQLASRRIRSGGALEFYRVYGPDDRIVPPKCYWLVSEYHDDGTHSTLRWVSYEQYEKVFAGGVDWVDFSSPLNDAKQIEEWIARANPTAIDCWPPKKY